MQEVAAHAAANNIKPATVLQNSANLGGGVWAKWEKGASCSLNTADKIRAYIAANPAPESGDAA